MMLKVAFLLCASAGFASAGLINRASETATVAIPQATILGSVNDNVESFNGIPFAEPPTGPLRLKPPQRLKRSLGLFDGTGSAPACPQFISSPDSTEFLESILGSLANLPWIQNVTGQTEDCLSITVTRPAGLSADAKLPVLFWIFGGAFELGWSSMYDGTSLVKHGISIDKPFIFVAVNYRVGGFGFLAGKEILADGAANLGLLDQRMGLQWVADNIASFGGDPEKVTIWGESAGSISVFDQMALFGGDHMYKGKPLFRAGIMSSGCTVPAEPIDSARAQAVYDDVVEAGGCADASDTLECLRGLDYIDFLNAVTTPAGLLSYAGVALTFLPRPDGRVLPDSPDVLLQQGKYAPVPFILGDQEDEGTLFSLFQPNITSKEDLVGYLHDIVWKSASEDELSELVDTYNDGFAAITEGSPFRTGLLNNVFPGFKRRAALLGDVLFTLSRRAFLETANEVNPAVPSWSYLGTYDHGTPILGTFHGSDLLQVFFGIFDNYAAQSTRTYLVNFLYSMDPNGDLSGEYPEWPQWVKAREILNIQADKVSLLKDDFRSDSYEVIKKLSGALRL
ncbi:Alpha/Beta hydrolase protein [Aspergillus lucknowensis]|uniref:Carboxylic ester hydrolase n=1 Tax=Aspergillus lucknowensis TaxID=176173 RepID=A0ABR4M3P7_9EURO